MTLTISSLPDDRMIELIRKYQIKPPIDILAIARELQIKVYRTKDWPISLSGQIVKDTKHGGESGYAIFINALHSLQRQRFTIAHELAHFLLHKPNIGDGITDDALYRSGLSNKEESMANQLAAEILMPWHLINWAMEQGERTIPELAASFRVSESAMSIRLGVPC